MSKEKKTPEAVLAELEKKYGLQKVTKEEIKIVDSGSHAINKATNLNGYPVGKLIEIYGQESGGKSTIVLHAIAQFQKSIPEKKAVLVDYEYSFDPRYAAKLGVDIKNLIIYQPDNQESGYDMIINLLEEQICSVIVIDSHTAAIPLKVIEGEMGDSTIGLQARNNSKFLGKVKGLIDKSNTTIIAVSQTRTNIGGMGDVNVPTGGNAWKFYADMRLKVWKSNDKANELNKTTVEVIKNKCAVPFGKAEFNIVWGLGIDNQQEIIDFAVEHNIIKKAGSWYSYGETKLGQGTAGVKEMFDSNPEMYEEIKNLVLNNE
jgi:recombination protein RecA